MKHLLTMVHISDLHFGDIAPDGDSKLESEAPGWWRHCSFFNGYLGHHAAALVDFADAFDKLQNDNDKLLLFITGDFTATGSLSQFDNAQEYLRKHIGEIGTYGPVGLELNYNPYAMNSVPGNHDHWPGNSFIFGKPDGLRSYYPGPVPPASSGLPIPIKVVTLNDSRSTRLSIAGIDTSAEVSPYGFNRIAARGHFVEQLKTLKSQWGPWRKGELRMLLMHHSPLARERYTCCLSGASRRVLEEFIRQLRVSIILTGDVHTPQGEILQQKYRTSSWPMVEARCGTTLQRDEVPASFIAPWLSMQRKFDVNTFLVHKLFEDNGTIKWKCKVFWRLSGGFAEKGWLEDKDGYPIYMRTLT